MKWYRVKPEFDNYKASRDYDILIGNELYTPAEARRACEKWAMRNSCKDQKVSITPATEQEFYAMLEPVEIPRNRVAWIFGARVALGD